jgi:hypothetical protein
MRMTVLTAAPALALLIVGCGIDRNPTAPDDPGVGLREPATLPEPDGDGGSHAGDAITGDRLWADGYVLADKPTSTSYTPLAGASLNWAGGPVRITRPDGTTGRYVVTFTGLSSALGARNTVRATGYGGGNAYCKTVMGYLVSDKVEVRCYQAGSGSPVNTRFTLLVSRGAADRAFAFGNQPTADEYTAGGTGSWSPGGPIRISRVGTGRYRVVFASLGSWTNRGQGHVTAVGPGKVYCALGEFWGGEPAPSDLTLDVACFMPGGSSVDSKFNVTFVTPAKHLAYAFGSAPLTPSYSPDSRYSTNPTGSPIVISRSGLGSYTIAWIGVDAAIIGSGNVQVSAVGTSNQCKVASQAAETVQVQCFDPAGTATESYFSVLLGS